VRPHFDPIHFLYSNDGYGEIMQFGNLGAKRAISHPMGIVNPGN
jgi:hypothetical protein